MTRWFDRWVPELFIVTVFVLTAFGALMTYSSSVFFAQEIYHNRLHFFYREMLWIGVGIGAAGIMMNVHYQALERWSWLLLVLATGALLLVYVPGLGRPVNHALRWIRIGPFSFQPSEFAKYALVIFVAARLTRHRRHIEHFMPGVFLPLLLAGLPLGLALIEPDLGTPAVIGFTLLLMCFAAGARLRYFVELVLAAVPAVGALIWMFPYRMKRIFIYLNPDSDPLGAGFQINQSLIAVCSGQLHGVGLGRSVQKSFYLPEAHTDFIYAIIGEELGFVGAGCLLAGFIVLLYLMYRLTRQIDDMFGHLVVTGIMTMIGLQTMINIGVVTALLPTKGIALPFISYGGSSMIGTLAACGLVLNIVYNQHNLRSTQTLARPLAHAVA